MGAQTDRFRYEVFQNLFLSPMNTVFLRDAVATVLTVYGIETRESDVSFYSTFSRLQQYLPFTVLKRTNWHIIFIILFVATVLTVYGIETLCHMVITYSMTFI